MLKNKEKYLWEHFYKKEDLDIKIPDISLYDYMMQETKDCEDLNALNYFGKKITFKVFWEYIDKCARAFISLGVRKKDVVTICMPNTPEAVIAFFAINKIGAISNMIHPLSAEGEIKEYLNSSHSTLLLIFNQFYDKVKNIIKDTSVYKVVIASASDSMPILLNGLYKVVKERKDNKPKNDSLYIFWKEFLRLGNSYHENVGISMSKDDDAVILHSGGTTGIPKSIVLSNRSFIALTKQGKITLNHIKKGNAMLTILPMFHGFGLLVCVYAPICLGMTSILIPKFDPKRFDKLITKYKPNGLCGVPTLYEALIQNKYMKKVDLSNVILAISGGDTLSVNRNKAVNEFLKEHGSEARIIQGYGLTEAASAVTFGALGSDKLGSVGAPLPGNIIKIINPETKKEVKTNEEGEIWIYTPAMMNRYLNDEKATKDTFYTLDGKKYIKTGDLGYIDEDGVLYYVQRIKRIIISSGYNVYPKHVENVLRDNKYIKDACVVGVPHPYKKEIVKAFIILKDGVEETYTVKKKIMDYVNKNLAHYMIPREYIFKKEFPKTKMLKTDYNKLREELIKKKEDL